MRTTGDPFDNFRKLHEQLRRLIEPPGLEAIRKQQEQIRTLTESPLLQAMREGQEQLRKLIEPPGLEAIPKQQEQIRTLTESPLLQAMREEQEQLRQLIQSPAFLQLQEQQRRMAEFIAQQPLEPLVQFQEELADRAIEYSNSQSGSDKGPVEVAQNPEQLALSRSRSFQFLLWQWEGLLKTLELTTAAAYAANEQAHEAVFSPSLLTVMVMVILVGELLIWFADGPPTDET